MLLSLDWSKTLLAALLIGLAGCSEPPASTGHDYPLDDVLRMNHVQLKGTHNSYHLAPDPVLAPEWGYSHAPLATQLSDQGVRQFELDAQYDDDLGGYAVYHVPLIDEESTCETLLLCLWELRSWSDSHSDHLPLVVMIEPKSEFSDDGTEALDRLEEEILVFWPPARLVTPDDVRGDRDSLREAVVEDGWPTLGEARGKALFFLLDRAGPFSDYTQDGTTLDGRVMFANADMDSDIGAMRLMDDAVDEAAEIESAVAAGFLVRTRADAASVEAFAGDATRLQTALDSGAQFLSTDYPAPVEGIDYVVEIPGGNPARCNPVSAPTECTSEALEAL